MNFKPVLLRERCFGVGDYPCAKTMSKDGKLYIPIGGCDEPFAIRSDDFGDTLYTEPVKKRNPSVEFNQLSDGTFMGFGFSNGLSHYIVDPEQEIIPYGLIVYRAKSVEDIANNRIDTDIVRVDIPRLSKGYGDSGNMHFGATSGWKQLSNGDIYLTMYGQFKDDNILCPYFDQNSGYKFYLYRTWAIVSHDMGKSFEFACTIADCQTYPIPDVNAEGYCEADFVEPEAGHLVCLLRTGGHEVVSPLYFSHSYDFGKTWTAPELLMTWGVLPKPIIMHDGTICVASGHIHTTLQFSADNGKTWSEPFIVEPCDGKWGDSATGYDSVFENKPGEVTVIYADPKEGNEKGWEYGRKRQVYAKTFRIDKE